MKRFSLSARPVRSFAQIAIVSGLGVTFVASALIFGCAQVLDLSGLREGTAATEASIDAGDADVEEAAAPDAGPCPRGEHQACNPILQCGCDIDENCEVTILNGTTSCSSTGDTPLWGNCKGFGVCQKGAECVDHACKPFCAKAQDCPGPGRLCVQVTSGDAAVPDLTVCSAGCDLLDPSVVCEPGVTCNPTPWDGQGMDHGDCVGGVGTGIGPGACPGNNSTLCAPGYSCDGDTCAKWCRLGHNEDCTSPATCTQLAVTPQINDVTYGLCE